MTPHTLPRSERLRSLKSIRRMFGEGKSGFVYPFRFTYYVSHRGEENSLLENNKNFSGIEIMFSVPKKFHKRANKRNLLKRRSREAYRLNECRDALRAKLLEQGSTIDMALIYSTKEIHSYKTISNAVQRILEQICEGL